MVGAVYLLLLVSYSPPLWRPLPPLPLTLHWPSSRHSCLFLHFLVTEPSDWMLRWLLLRLALWSAWSVLLVLIASSPMPLRWLLPSLLTYHWMWCGFHCTSGISHVCGCRVYTALQCTPQCCTDGCWCSVALTSSHILISRCICSLCGPSCSHAHICCLGLHSWMIRLGTTLPLSWSLLRPVFTPP